MEIRIEVSKMSEESKQELIDWLWEKMNEEVLAAEIEFKNINTLPVALRRIAAYRMRESRKNAKK